MSCSQDFVVYRGEGQESRPLVGPEAMKMQGPGNESQGSSEVFPNGIVKQALHKHTKFSLMFSTKAYSLDY